MNVAQFLPGVAAETPSSQALIYRRRNEYEWLTFAELDRHSDALAHGLKRHGLQPGERVLMMVPNSPEFVTLVFALFKLGALPVLIDPGMGVPGMLRCIAQARPVALIGVLKAQLLRAMFRAPFRSVRLSVTVGGKFPGTVPLTDLYREEWAFPIHDPKPEDTAAILFTSGSTGPPKGVVYRHEIFRAQVGMLRDTFGFRAGEIDMPGFPLFALFSTALGLTCVLPELDASRPAACQPEKLVRAIQDWKVNNLHGSPAIWKRVGDYCTTQRIRLNSLKRLLTFGASIQPELMRTWTEIMPPEAEIFTPYGATEALPVTCITGREVLHRTALLTAAGAGTCVGQPVPGIELRIIKITDSAIPKWKDDLPLPPGEFGEVVVAGDVVTWEYDGLPEETERSKISQGGRIWHRMGDLGYLDGEGRLWLLGRKAHRVDGEKFRYFPDAAEGMVNPDPRVARSALVGVGPRGQQLPVIVVEPRDPALAFDTARQRRVTEEILHLLAPHPVYREIKNVLYRRSLPVDRRHNAKIHREELAAWAARRIKP